MVDNCIYFSNHSFNKYFKNLLSSRSHASCCHCFACTHTHTHTCTLQHICVCNQPLAIVHSPFPMSLCHGQHPWTLVFIKPFQLVPRHTRKWLEELSRPLKSESESVSRSVTSDYSPTRLLCPWDSPGKNTEWVANHFSGGSSWSRDWTQFFGIGGRFSTL